MPRPLIGITMDSRDPSGPYYQLHFDYTAAVEKAGGLPFPIPYHLDRALIPQIVDRLDGILFTGGDDLDPALYGQERHPRAKALDAGRLNFELLLLAEVERRRLPALCICLGCQLLNVYRGGSLTQFIPDLPEKMEHRKVGSDLPRHDVKLTANSKLASLLETRDISANSYHKQAIDRLGRGLRVVATAPDGIIEGIEDPEFPLLTAVQWHPERLADEPEHLALFLLLVEKSIEGMKRRSHLS